MGHSTSSGRNRIGDNEYRYHGTTRRALESIARQGLIPSTKGRAGGGIYFAYDEDSARDWASDQHGGATSVLRVRGSALNKAGYQDENDEEGISPNRIDPKDIEVLALRPRGGWTWMPLQDYVRQRRRRR